MIHSASEIDAIDPEGALSEPSEKDLPSTAEPSNPSHDDSVHLKPEFLLKLISAQIVQLKKELPGIISDAVLSTGNIEAMRKSPSTALNFRLDRPLKYYLGEGNHLSADLVLELREKIQQLKDEIPSLQDQALLAPIRDDEEKAVLLDAILAGLSCQLDGIISSLYQSLAESLNPL